MQHGKFSPLIAQISQVLVKTIERHFASIKRYQKGIFIDDINASIEDAGSFGFANYPWIDLIVDNSRSDLKIITIYPYNWYQIIANRLFLKYVDPKQDKLTSEQNIKIQSIFKTLPENLTRVVPGNHFFFIGEIGAKKAGKSITLLDFRYSLWSNEAESFILGMIMHSLATKIQQMNIVVKATRVAYCYFSFYFAQP